MSVGSVETRRNIEIDHLDCLLKAALTTITMLGFASGAELYRSLEQLENQSRTVYFGYPAHLNNASHNRVPRKNSRLAHRQHKEFVL